MENDFFVDSDKLSEKALEKKHRLENDPSSRTDHMAYMEGMEQISPEIREKVLSQMESYDYSKYTAVDVRRALQNDRCSVEDFKALLSPAAEPPPPKAALRAAGRLWRDLIIAKTGRAQTPTVAPASGARQRHAGICAGTVLLTEEKTGKISVVAWENYPQGTFRPAPRGS